ncbi:MAG: hypothetical protein OEY20_08125 [Gemmatimonadota bacterium]|nr:hypothetical protein [Gemmatimonadota bacterium]MDH5197202.1 hypothetical protein [Gemmatimonadota bacterium]
MTALTVAATNGAVHTGACVAVPPALMNVLRGLRGLMADPAPREREYCLHDEGGRPVGVIHSPAGRPQVGRSAPAVYLRRPD